TRLADATTFSLSSTDGGTAKFYSDAAGEDEITSITIEPGTDISTVTPSYTFYYSNTKAGDQTITAEYDDDGDEGLEDAGSWGYDVIVNAGVAEKLFFAQHPADAIAGETIAPDVVVHIVDEYGNLVTMAADAITLGTGDGLAALKGTTSRSAVGGVATFDD